MVIVHSIKKRTCIDNSVGEKDQKWAQLGKIRYQARLFWKALREAPL